jgi:predicted nucleic acid-binding protein
VQEIAKRAGIDMGEAIVIMLAREKEYLVLIDDLAARRFAIGMGLEVAGSIGVLIKAVKAGINSKEISMDVYEDARRIFLKRNVFQNFFSPL